MGKKNKDKAMRVCVLCGQPVPIHRTDCVVGATGNVACNECLQISQKMKDVQPDSSPTSLTVPIQTPQEIIAGLDRSIIGQQEAKEAVALAMWKQMLRANGETTIPKCNLLLHGPTGCGKTALITAAAKLVGLPVQVVDSTCLVESGYKGKDPENAVMDFFEAFEDYPNVKHGVIFLDEIDKIAVAQDNDYQGAYRRGTQQSLLKVIEGTEVRTDSKIYDTSNLMFVLGGAFSHMRRKESKATRAIGFESHFVEDIAEQTSFEVSDFVSGGMEAEFMGRVGQIVPLHPLSEQDLTRIILESDLSVYSHYQRFFAGRGVELTLTKKAAENIAHHALVRGTGARGLNTRIEQLVAPLLLRLAVGDLPATVDLLEGGKRYEAS